MFSNQKIRLISVITVKPLGEQTLPDEYIHLQKKPDNLTWDEFTVLARKQFKIDQENELKRLKDKKQQLVFHNAQTILQAKLDAKRKANKQLQLQKQKDEGRSGQITNYQINLVLIGIIQICLKILLFVETPPAMGGCLAG